MTEMLIHKIDAEIEKRSLLKHKFYVMWTEGKLSMDDLKGYSREYFQLVKRVPDYVGNLINNYKKDEQPKDQRLLSDITSVYSEEQDHISPWIDFSNGLGISSAELLQYEGNDKVIEHINNMKNLSSLSFEQGAATMYAFEKELPKISKSKIDGLKNFYGITDDKTINYFKIHEVADIRHAKIWENVLQAASELKEEVLLNTAISSLDNQNGVLDAIYDRYIQNKSEIC